MRVLVTGSERGWFTVLQRESLTQNSIVSFYSTARHTQGTLTYDWKECFFFSLQFEKCFKVKRRRGRVSLIHRKQSCHTNTMTVADLGVVF